MNNIVKMVVFFILAIAILVGVFWVMRPDTATSTTPNSQVATGLSVISDAEPAEHLVGSNVPVDAAADEAEPQTPSPSSATNLSVAESAVEPTLEQASPADFYREIQVVNGEVPDGLVLIDVVVGTHVTLAIRSNQRDELHVHSYDHELQILADQVTELTFVADQTGEFEFELHKQHRTIGLLRVSAE